MKLRVHNRLSSSRANGPGKRAVIWVQGCSLGCPGCYNPETHEGDAGNEVDVDELIDWLEASVVAVEGVSVSGGEPLEQAAALRALVEGLRERLPELSILIFSGFKLTEIEKLQDGPEILALTDVLIDGRYVSKLHNGAELRGSNNQGICCLTDRYTVADVEATPATEVSIAPDGSVILTGVSPLEPI